MKKKTLRFALSVFVVSALILGMIGWHSTNRAVREQTVAKKKEPIESPSEKPKLFMQLVFHACAEELIGESKAAELLGKSLAEFGPKSTQMILVVERTEMVNWMDPTGDLPQAAAGDGFGVLQESGIGIGSQHPGGSNAGHRDGAARFLSETTDTEQLNGLLQGTTDSF